MTKIITKHPAVEPAWLRDGDTEVSVFRPNSINCSVNGEGQYRGEVINEVLEEGDVRQAEYGADGLFHVLRDEASTAKGSRTTAAESSA